MTSSSSSSGFKVDLDALNAVADEVNSLLADIQGQHGYIAGNLPEFQKIASIGAAMAPYWGGDANNVYASAYADEYGAVNTTYTTIITQLTSLAAAAKQTAAAYQAQEAASKAGINNVGSS